ncbi:tRNA dihydrouridine synthase DusB [Candidatus Pacearchaeota archaeon CG1_02_32_21]|nr:MAG: tRNA dihydrouridine synthase DusB [Candidatus Pacearchaeota archaeon CG1_02_32_21]
MKSFPKLQGKAILSPMEGVTDVAFRELCRRYGAALTYTEFVNSTAIVRKSKKSLDKIKTSKIEKPVAVQLFGNSIKNIIEAAKFCETKFDIIDINCGCPAWKVIQTGAGSAMLNNPEKIKEIISQLSDSVKIPITLKIRKGMNEENINAVEIAKIAEKSGASAIAVHGRTQKQGYSGKADWEIIKKVKQAVKIPVIGNGDVFTPEDFKKRLDESGVDYILIARGALGNPYIFKQINDYLLTGRYDSKDKIGQLNEYIELALKHKILFRQIKTHAVSFTKGLQGGSELRKEINLTKSLDKLKALLTSFRKI